MVVGNHYILGNGYLYHVTLSTLLSVDLSGIQCLWVTGLVDVFVEISDWGWVNFVGHYTFVTGNIQLIESQVVAVFEAAFWQQELHSNFNYFGFCRCLRWITETGARYACS